MHLCENKACRDLNSTTMKTNLFNRFYLLHVFFVLVIFLQDIIKIKQCKTKKNWRGGIKTYYNQCTNGTQKIEEKFENLRIGNTQYTYLVQKRKRKYTYTGKSISTMGLSLTLAGS